MCGIGGILDLKGRRITARHVERMNEAQRHRGPDDWGGVLFEVDGVLPPRQWGPGQPQPTGLASACFAHVRLSILDLSQAGHQPMGSADGTLWLAYNGEVYNYLELREELSGRGFSFRSSSDTEVVLAAYEAWGVDAFRRFNGMWGLALWDGRAGRLVCSRDRMGIKPFHYAEADGFFAFASEVAALHTVSEVPRSADAKAVARFLAWAEMPAGSRSFFQGVRRLEPGHLLVLEPGHQPRVERWWAPTVGRRSLTSDEAVERVRWTLEDAVRVHLRSDVPVGVCLSGGVDSSSLTCVMKKVWRERAEASDINAFTARFPDPGCEESEYAAQVAGLVDSNWFLVEPDAARFDMEELTKLVRTQGEPFPNLSMYAQYCVFRRMREEGVPVALDGQGADELFWGYTWHYAHILSDLARSGSPGRLGREAVGVLRNNHLGSTAQLLLSLGYFWVPRARETRAALSFHHGLTAGCWRLAGSSRNGDEHPRGMIDRRLYDLQTAPLPALLRYEDRNSMAFSVESRLPFLDHRLVDLALDISERDLIKDGWSKVILRRAMSGIVPDGIRWRRSKLGFNAPTGRLLNGLRPQLRELFVDSPQTADLAMPQAVLTQVEADKPLPAWVVRALMVEMWMRVCGLDRSWDRASPPGQARPEARPRHAGRAGGRIPSTPRWA